MVFVDGTGDELSVLEDVLGGRFGFPHLYNLVHRLQQYMVDETHGGVYPFEVFGGMCLGTVFALGFFLPCYVETGSQLLSLLFPDAVIT